ncbi:MAG: hypothetical protein M3198_03675 [Actinomycetota bacterium]|nr:hypothetical protein [Actinomycetota bacterium]
MEEARALDDAAITLAELSLDSAFIDSNGYLDVTRRQDALRREDPLYLDLKTVDKKRTIDEARHLHQASTWLFAWLIPFAGISVILTAAERSRAGRRQYLIRVSGGLYVLVTTSIVAQELVRVLGTPLA